MGRLSALTRASLPFASESGSSRKSGYVSSKAQPSSIEFLPFTVAASRWSRVLRLASASSLMSENRLGRYMQLPVLTRAHLACLIECRRDYTSLS